MLVPTPRRLIVNADDFGRTPGINAAVIRAHREGILTTASLMVNEKGCAEAVQLAQENPGLGVGLHLSLLCGHSALSQDQIPGLVNPQGEFTDRPTRAGWRYYFCRGLRAQLRGEIIAQLERFEATGLKLDHVNGHLHLHLHPVVLSLLLEQAKRFGIQRIRLTRDPLRLNLRLAGGRWLYRLSHAAIFQALSRRAARPLERHGIRYVEHVFGLLQDTRVDERYILRLLPVLPEGDSELYSHPSLDEFANEFDALVSPRVKSLAASLGIQLIRYEDL